MCLYKDNMEDPGGDGNVLDLNASMSISNHDIVLYLVLQDVTLQEAGKRISFS